MQRLSILDPRFQYVPSHQTDVRLTFARERQRIMTERQVISQALSILKNEDDAQTACMQALNLLSKAAR